jgi:hypothetical protein
VTRPRVTVDRTAVDRIVDRRGEPGAIAAASFLLAEQRRLVRSRRLRARITAEHGKDRNGWYARAGMATVRGTSAFFWYFHEFQQGKGPPGQPFIRPSLENNRAIILRLFVRGG